MKYSSSIDGARIHLAASKEATRYAIQGVQVEPIGDGRGMAVATDGRILAAAPIEYGEADTQATCVVPLAAFATMEKERSNGMHLNGKATVRTSTGEQSFNLLEVRFPAWREVMPSVSEQARGFKVCFDADKLKQLADALTTKKGQRIVELTIIPGKNGEPSNMPIVVHVPGQDGRIGLIMPCGES